MMPEFRPRTRAYLPYDEDEDREKLLRYCLMEDIRYGLTPSPLGGGMRVEIACSAVNRRDVTACFEYAHSRSIESFIDGTATNITHFGASAFEIVDIDTGPFALFPIMPNTWRISGGRLVQQIPALEGDDDTPRTVSLEPDEYYVFRSHEVTQRRTAKMWSTLKRLDEVLEASHSLEAYQSIGTDRVALNVAILKATARIGWPPRPRPENMTEHYLAYRTLVFRKFLAGFRRDILHCMNDVLRKIGDRRRFQAYVTIPSLKSPGAFQTEIDELLAGSRGLTAALETW